MKRNLMPLSVQLLAMSQASLRNISGFIKTKGKTHFTLSDAQPAEVIIIDIDTQEGKDLFLQHRTNNTQSHIVTLSLSPVKDDGISSFQIQKPITGVELIRTAEKIKSLAKKNKASAKNNIPDKHLTKKTANDNSQRYEPSETLQGMLRRAIQLSDKEKISVVLHIQQYCIEINTANNKACFNFPMNRLRSLCYFPLTASTCLIEKESLDHSSMEYVSLPIAELSWNTALLCSRGRAPANLNDESLYQLKRWPNLTRWIAPDNALAIASLWTKSPYSITTIAEQLDIPIIDVRSFITAALDSQLALICEEAAEVIPFKAKNKNSAMFKKLLDRLKRA